MRFVVIGLHEPRHVAGINELTARVRMFPGESKEGAVDADFAVPPMFGIVHTVDSPLTRHVIEVAVNERMAAEFGQ